MDVLVRGAGNSTSSYFMRARDSQGPGCDQMFDLPSPTDSALAIVQYENANPSILPQSIASPFNDTCSDAPIAIGRPFRTQGVVTDDVLTVNVEITTGTNATDFLLFFMNNSSFFGDFNDPVLRDVAEGQTKFPTMYNIYDTGNAKHVRFEIVNNSPATHPIHMHGT
jgi:hypothetical protein